jgi:hypothetical protein
MAFGRPGRRLEHEDLEQKGDGNAYGIVLVSYPLIPGFSRD